MINQRFSKTGINLTLGNPIEIAKEIYTRVRRNMHARISGIGDIGDELPNFLRTTMHKAKTSVGIASIATEFRLWRLASVKRFLK